MRNTIDQTLKHVDRGFTVTNLDPQRRLESDEHGEPIEQLKKLLRPGTGSFAAEPGIRLLAWDAASGKWYAWIEQA